VNARAVFRTLQTPEAKLKDVEVLVPDEISTLLFAFPLLFVYNNNNPKAEIVVGGYLS